MVCVAEEVFDELLGVVATSARGFKDLGSQVDARVPVELFLFFAFAMKLGRALAAEVSPALGENGVTTAVSMWYV